MKQYKSGFLVLIGLAFATLLAVINFKGLNKPQVADPAVSIADQLPVETNAANQQMAVETQPVPTLPQSLPDEVERAEIQGLTIQEIAPTDKGPQSGALSFIAFSSLRENLDLQGYQINWRAYRQYRRSLAQSPQNS